MRKRFAWYCLVAIVAPIMGLWLGMGPAFAAQHDTPVWCQTHTYSQGSIKFCEHWQWHDPVDGTGIEFTSWHGTFTQSCPVNLEGHTMEGMQLVSFKHNGAVLDVKIMDDMLDCAADRDISDLKSVDDGYTYVEFRGNVNVDFGDDYDLLGWCYIYPNNADECGLVRP